jgi:RNA polymerase sigma factor for flagellar operon FliA
VLVVDDDPQYLGALLRSAGKHARWLEVVGLSSAAHALEYVLQRSADLVIMDAYMPGTTGIEACRRLRAFGLESPLALVSAFMTSELEDEALEAGATYALPKPVDVAALLEHVATVEVVEPQERHRLIEEHLDVARNIARRLVRRYGWMLDADDIDSSAMVGLCEAAERFDRARPEPFLAFAERRIRGAVLDELRRLGSYGRVASRRMRHISTARRAILASGETATEDRIAEHLGLSLATIQKARERTHRASSDEAAALPSLDISPAAKLENAESLSDLSRALDALSEIEATVIALRYDAGMSLARVARTLELTLGRIRHIHAKGLTRLRDQMKQSETGTCESAPGSDGLERAARRR